MKLTFVQLSRFVARWREHRLTDDDLQALEEILLQGPETGSVIAGTGGLRKVRFAPPSRHVGKRGAFRVGYAYFRFGDTVYLLALFAKNEQANLTAAEKAEAKALLAIIAERHQPRPPVK